MKKIILMLTIMVQVSFGFSQVHFVKSYIGGGTDQMSLVIRSANIGGVQLENNDEIAVFDGNLCVGVILVTQPIDSTNSSTYPQLKASADDGNLNGFTAGNTMYFRFWDSDPGVEYHNIVPRVTDNGGTPITNQFTTNGTAFISAKTATTTRTWKGFVPGVENWTYDFNWLEGKVPEPNSDVIIPVVVNQPKLGPTDKAYCGSLTFTGTPTLTVESTSSGTGSLIVANDITGSATINMSRYMTGNDWHMVSSPVSGQTITSFLSANGDIATNGSSRGMMDYDEAADNWNSFFTNATVGDLTLGKGFAVRTGSDISVTSTGSMSNADVSVAIAADGNGWNLVGNPYTSAIYTVQEVFGFITENSGALHGSYQAIYLWDPTANGGTGGYIIVNNTDGQKTLAPGQGFFVKAAGAGNVTFKQTMQVHESSTTFKSAKTPWSNLVLTAKVGELSSTTKINFNEEMSAGLDPGYDAGILRSGNGFDIFTRLVNDNGVDFAIQALPGNSAEKYFVPIGVDANNGGDIVFSVQALNLPVSYEVVLEDKLTNTLTDLTKEGEYATNLAANSKGIGRFYLHVGSSLQTGIQSREVDDVIVYQLDRTLFIKGAVDKDAKFSIYNMDGRLIDRYNATSQNLNKINIAGYTPGVYLINIYDRSNHKSLKFVIGD